MKTCICEKCNKEIGINNFSRHIKKCDGSGIRIKSLKSDNWILTDDGFYECKICSRKFNLLGFSIHIKSHENTKEIKVKEKKPRVAWNKGLTKDTSDSVKRSKETLKEHLRNGTVTIVKGPLSDEHRKAVSEGMKKAHSEGRAWNIGKSRWNNKPSYPETFFIKVIENEFEDKNYVREFPFGRYSLDFAWPAKKICIEIDGDQHQRFIEYKQRDEKKDNLLKENDWKVLRISWKEMCNNTKYWIEISKNFVNNV